MYQYTISSQETGRWEGLGAKANKVTYIVVTSFFLLLINWHSTKFCCSPFLHLQLSAKRFVNVRMFNGRYLVDIREFYTDDAGERKPGRKGGLIL